MASGQVAPGDIKGAPLNLRSTVTGTTVRLDWDFFPGEFVGGFLIEAGSGPGLSNLARFAAPSNPPAVVVTNVPDGVYYVRVRGIDPVNPALAGPPSNEIIVTVGGSCTPPNSPVGFTAQVVGNNVNLFWSAPNGGGPPSAYIVEAGSASGLSNVVVFDTGNAATTLAAVAGNGVYHARIRARNACGVSGPSNEFVVVIGPVSGSTSSSTTTISGTTIPTTSTTVATTSVSTVPPGVTTTIPTTSTSSTTSVPTTITTSTTSTTTSVQPLTAVVKMFQIQPNYGEVSECQMVGNSQFGGVARCELRGDESTPAAGLSYSWSIIPGTFCSVSGATNVANVVVSCTCFTQPSPNFTMRANLTVSNGVSKASSGNIDYTVKFAT